MLVLVRSRNWQNNRIRWFRRATSVLINHRNFSVSSDKWSIQRENNHQKCLNGKKESSCFRMSQMSKIIAIMNNTTAERSRGGKWCSFVGFNRKVRSACVLSTTLIIFKSTQSGDCQIRSHEASLLFQWQIHSSLLTGHSLILKLKML